MDANNLSLAAQGASTIDAPSYAHCEFGSATSKQHFLASFDAGFDHAIITAGLTNTQVPPYFDLPAKCFEIAGHNAKREKCGEPVED